MSESKHEQLRAAFDRGFAEPYPPPRRDSLALIALTIAGVAYAIRLEHIATVHVDVRVGAVPSKARGLVGLATIRNVIVPVRDLGVLLGHRTVPVAGRWIVVGRGEPPCAWSFDQLDGQVRIEPPEGGVGGLVEIAGRSRRVIDLEEVRDVS
ncbi:MAG: chemotaxis protein CheW [Kofleriaceae bacterium]